MKKIGILLLILFFIPVVLGAGSGSGGSSGSSGNSGGSRAETIDFATKNSFDQTFNKGNVYSLTLKDTRKFFLYTKNIEGNTIYFILRGSEKELQVSVGFQVEIDLDDDGTNDLLLTLNSIPSDSKAAITVTDTFEKSSITTESTSGLLCGDRNTRQERIRCRLHLQKEALEEEYTLKYLPEECKDLSDPNREECIQRYKGSQRCWGFKEDASRVNCVKNVLKFKGIIEEREICDSLKDSEKRICIGTLKENVFSIIKFRFYNLEERAEDLMKEGKVSENDTVTFIAAVEGKKTEFNTAVPIEQKKEIVKEVETLWIAFQKLQ